MWNAGCGMRNAGTGMRRAFSLVEVLISIALVSGIIAILFQIKQNNLYFLEKFQKQDEFGSIVSIASLDNSNNLRNKKVYMADLVDFNDDDIRKKLKEKKIKVKDEKFDTISYESDEYSINIEIIKNQFTLDDLNSLSKEDSMKKLFYRIKSVDQ